LEKPRSLPARFPVYYGWTQVALAAAAMVATLPGRTQGLGLITEPLLTDLRIGRVAYAEMNLGGTLLGAAFCLPIGLVLDRLGTRAVLAAVLLALGAVVLAMSGVAGAGALFLAITLTRGLGQSALSVVSLALVGKWFARRLAPAMGVYSLLVGLGFMAAFPAVGRLVVTAGWRQAWFAVGLCLLALAGASALLVRNTPEACGLRLDGRSPEGVEPARPAPGWALGRALRSPAFWVFGLASSVYGLVSSGIGLFNQSILEERGFGAATYHRVLVLSTCVALACNFVGGWLAGRWSMGRLMGLAMGVLATALVALPLVRTDVHVDCYAVAMGAAGGVVTMVFFAFWGHAFGRAHLGKIQGAAQMLTVLASAVGPVLLAQCHEWTGSYVPLFYALVPVVGCLAVAAWFVPLPDAGPINK
jgi:MFS family permease